MAKKCICSPGSAEVPTWFMTYSDVITLLMTFFILLLTFATNEPESFERMHSIDGLSGLGWYSSVFPSFPGTEVGGVDDGYLSEAFISKTDDIGIVILTNINDENAWMACKAVELALLNKYAKASE